MDRLTIMAKELVQNRTKQEKRFFLFRKAKVLLGKGLLCYAVLPVMSAWAVVPGMMLVGIRPTVWARSKMIDLKEGWRLR